MRARPREAWTRSGAGRRLPTQETRLAGGDPTHPPLWYPEPREVVASALELVWSRGRSFLRRGRLHADVGGAGRGCGRLGCVECHDGLDDDGVREPPGGSGMAGTPGPSVLASPAGISRPDYLELPADRSPSACPRVSKRRPSGRKPPRHEPLVVRPRDGCPRCRLCGLGPGPARTKAYGRGAGASPRRLISPGQKRPRARR